MNAPANTRARRGRIRRRDYHLSYVGIIFVIAVKKQRREYRIRNIVMKSKSFPTQDPNGATGETARVTQKKTQRQSDNTSNTTTHHNAPFEVKEYMSNLV